MIIFIEYSFNGELARIAFDISGHTVNQAKALIPEWLKQENIEYDSYNVYQILESLAFDTL